MLVPLREAIRLTKLSGPTLRKYADEGRIKTTRLSKRGQRLFDTESLLGRDHEKRNGVVCYCRVSSRKQKEDLARQVAYMRQQFPGSDIVQDIGSGLNFKRAGLQSVLERIMRGDRLTLIVAHRDRLCRFGFELIEFLVNRNGGEIVVLDRQEVSPARELTEDLLSILHVFSCRMHGLRRYANQIKEDKDLSDQGAEDNA